MTHIHTLQPTLIIELATTKEDILASQILRYQVFAEEQGAALHSGAENIDRDYYDRFCHHLLVREQETGEVVGSTRILTAENARDAGSFYSENEFNLTGMLSNLSGNVIEIGRTCIRKDYRNGYGISMLWTGLSQFIKAFKVDYMFGCASVSYHDGGLQTAAIINQVRKQFLAPENLQVTPRLPVMASKEAQQVQMPPLLKIYLKVGAWIAGEPCLDPDFNVADFFVLFDVDKLQPRYQKRFMGNNRSLIAQKSLAFNI